MARQYPPLNSLLYFVTAARTSSFTLAAEELFVTRSAVSRQVKGLEDFLGVRLFIRSKSGLTLTPEGLVYSNSLSLIFEDIKSATKALLGEEENHLKLGISPTFNATWLMSRLSDFYELHPSLTIDFVTNPLDTIEETIDLKHDSIDAAIRIGHGNWDGCKSEKLLDIYVQLVCAPKLLESEKLADNLLYLQDYNWLHYKHLPKLWSQWLDAAGIGEMETRKKHIELDNVAIAVQAAIDGLGVIPMYRPLADPLLESGQLVIAHPYPMLKRESYYFVCPENSSARAPADIFGAWIVSVAQEFRTRWSQEFANAHK